MVRGDPPVRMGGVHALDDRGLRECGTPAFTPYFAEGTETCAEPWRAFPYERGHVYSDEDRPERLTYHTVREDPLVALKVQVPDAKAEFAPSVYFETSAPDGEGNTALHHAVMQNDIDAAAACVDMGADLNQPNGVGKTPRDLAAEIGGDVLTAVQELERRRAYTFFASHGLLGELLQFVPPKAVAELLNDNAMKNVRPRTTERMTQVYPVAACQGLGLRGDAEARAMATRIARKGVLSEDPEVRAAAAEALGRLGLAGACFTGVVAPLVKDSEDSVRR